jgi:outer membrane lipoprotein-sorting protein
VIKSRLFLVALATATIALGASIHPAAAANPTPAIAAFRTAFAGVNDYTLKLHSHEVKGGASEDRMYQYSFMRPHYAKTFILSGDDSGSGGVWTGGDQVSGHRGGFLSGIHLKVDLHDSKATSLLGYTIPDGLMQNIVERLASTPGTLTERGGGTLDGQATDMVTLEVANPSTQQNGITKQQVYFSRSTHWPVRAISWVGDKSIQDQTFMDIKTNVGLTQNDFPF